jgi:Amt family ammonium transporter
MSDRVADAVADAPGTNAPEKEVLMLKRIPLIGLAALLLADPAFAQDSVGASIVGLDTLFVLVSAFLVFLMQAGFGMLEAGFIRAKNTCNILTKNFLDYCMASLGFFVFGYAIMFSEGNPFFGTSGFFLVGAESGADVPLWAYWLFQAAFCGAAATIVAGGMAERMKFPAYLAYSFIISAFIYPIVGHWTWGGGWLAQLDFFDFAGSTVVHLTGGATALVGAMILGPRLGRFNADGSSNAIPGHSVPLASLGVFILWFGWFGFNPGSALSVGDGEAISLIAINTNLAAAAAAVTTTFISWILFGKPDLFFTMNGALAGLVSITAPCAVVSPAAAIWIGVTGGFVIVLGEGLLRLIKVDDPCGAFPVHGLCGIWGTLTVGLWGRESLGLAREGLFYGGGFEQLGIQALGTFASGLFVFLSMGLVFIAIKAVLGLRVDRMEEIRGLDMNEHGMESYTGFQILGS